MEYLGSKPTSMFGTVHGSVYSWGAAISKSYTLPNDRFENDFHIGIEWGENYINYYVDDVLYNQITPDDYWFTIDLKNGEIIKGHFSLKR